MAVNTPNPGVYFTNLGAHVVNFRDALQALLNDAAYLNAMGGATFLEAAPFSLSSADAATVMNTVGQVTPANSTVQAIQSFLASTEPLWGGS